MRIRFRIVLVVGITVLLTTAAVTVAVVRLAGDLLDSDATQAIGLLTERFGMRIRLKVDEGVEKAEGLARLVAGLSLVPATDREAFLGAALSSAVGADDSVRGAWAVAEALPGAKAGLSIAYTRGDDGISGGRSTRGIDDAEVAAVRESAIPQVFEPRTEKNAEGNASIVLTVAAPVTIDGRIAGVVGVDLSMNEILTMVDSARNWKGSYGFLVSDSGTIVVHADPSLVGKKLIEAGGYSPEQAAVLAKAKTARGSTSMIKKEMSGLFYQSFYSIAFASTAAVWTFAVSVPQAEIRAGALRFAGTTTAIAALVLVLALVAAWIQGYRISRPLVRLRDEAKRMAESRDLGFAIVPKSRDEASESIRALGALFEELRGFVEGTRHGADELRESGDALAVAMEETTKTTEAIAAAAVRARHLAENQGASTQEVAASSLQIARRAEELSTIAERQASSAAKNGESLESLVAGAKAVHEGFTELSAAFGALVREAESGNARLDAAALANEDVARRSEDLLAANRVLANIAAKTNILAMNAAIEAAHAGQFGQGFSVVAQEIRSLAETASSQSREFEKTLKDIRAGIHGANESSLSARDAFASMAAMIGRADRVRENIGETVGRQAAAFETAGEAVAVSAASAREVADAAVEMRQSGRENAAEMERLVRGGTELLDAIDAMEAGSRAIAEKAEDEAGRSRSTKERLEALAERAAAFRTG